MIKSVKVRDFSIGDSELVILAGPCAIEADGTVNFKTAEKLKEITAKLNLPFIFKSSYDKANRTSLTSYRGPGIDEGLEILAKIKKEFDVPIVTDVHNLGESEKAAEVADVIQVPAFLCRQTDLLVEAAKTGKVVNIKKGQFMEPKQIENSARKVIESGNDNVVITERGVTFGYGNLVSDMRAIPIVQSLGYPVIFDATHSVQLPGGAGTSSSGQREFVQTLARAAVASGCKGLFLEIHPEPEKALCDGANMVSVNEAYDLLAVCKEIFEIVNRG